MKLRLYHHHDGARVAYREAGTGRPLALLHSKLLSHREWEPLVEELSDRFRLILPDLPLHGDSEDRPRHPYSPDWMAELMASFLRDVCGPRPLVGGHEAGAQILLRAVVTRQLSPGRLVLMSNAMHRRPERERLEKTAGLAIRSAAVPGLDRLVSHAGRYAYRPTVGEKLSARGNPAARSSPSRSGRRCIAFGISTSRPGRSWRVTTARSRIWAPMSWPPTSGRGPQTSRQKPAMTSASQSGE